MFLHFVPFTRWAELKRDTKINRSKSFRNSIVEIRQSRLEGTDSWNHSEELWVSCENSVEILLFTLIEFTSSRKCFRNFENFWISVSFQFHWFHCVTPKHYAKNLINQFGKTNGWDRYRWDGKALSNYATHRRVLSSGNSVNNPLRKLRRFTISYHVITKACSR